jgi:hypothetical protein|tara:strand:+ start:652 stop:1581 length:930 start_codon:yes stop_codon:yes gene_type:complete
MKIEKWLYFRTVANEDDDDGDAGAAGTSPTSICFPASAIKTMAPASDTSLEIKLDSLKILGQDNTNRRTNWAGDDSVVLNVTQGKTFEVMEAITQAVAGAGDGFVVVADDMTTNYANDTVVAQYLHPNITSCGAITVYTLPQGFGMHEYYEIVTPMTADDDDVAASLSIKLPTHCILLEAAMVNLALATSANASVALEFHNAVIADDAASGGTEWIGADTLNLTQVEDADDYGATTNTADNTSIPQGVDLAIGSGDTLNDVIHSGVADPIDRAVVTYFHVCSKEDMSSMTGTPKVGVYVKWWGGPAVVI